MMKCDFGGTYLNFKEFLAVRRVLITHNDVVVGRNNCKHDKLEMFSFLYLC